jgi:signal transduction histidine kinase
VLELLASQAAISLENASLYSDLQRSEAYLAQGQSISHTGSFGWNVPSGEIYWSEETYNIFEYDRAAKPILELVLRRTHPDDRDLVQQTLDRASEAGANFDFEHRLLMPDGSVKHLHVLARALETSSGDLEFVGTVIDITERKRAENAFRDSSVQLRALSRRLVELQESERRELSRELHDRVGQNLTALKINIDMLQPALTSHRNEDVHARVADSAALLESTMDAIEDVMSELRPPMLDDHGLAAALDWHARTFSRRTGIAVVVHADEPTVQLAPQVQIALFRIAQEALNNIAKHAGARHAEIALDEENGDCVMSVRDDGIGFDVGENASDKPKAGIGIVTMRERSQAVGGRFEVQGLPERGTRLTVRVPC